MKEFESINLLVQEQIPKSFIYAQFDAQYSIDSLYRAAHAMLALFLKENVTGRSWHYRDSEEQLSDERLWRQQKFWDLDYERDVQLYLQTVHCSHSHTQQMIDELSMGGEIFNDKLRYIRFLYYAKNIFENLNLVTCRLWVARIYFLINEILYTPVEQCKLKAIDGFLSFLKDKQDFDKQTQSMLYVEFSNMLLFYYKYHTSWQYLQLAEQQLGVKFELVGKLGKRTKYQIDKTAQLVAQVVSQEEQQEIDELPKPEEVLMKFTPKNEELEEDTILLEKPQVDQDETENKNVKQGKLTLHEHILLLGFLNHLHSTTPYDEVLQEQTQAYLDLMLDISNDWLVYSKGLLLRSLNEFSRLKKMQRALMQLQTLVDQNNDKEPQFENRIKMYFSIKYPHYFALNKILGQYWMKAGGMQSGYEIFARLEMWDECIECLVSLGETERAIKEIKKMKKLSPKVKCILGELTQDIKLLEQVWQESKLARAQRSIADIHFFKFKDYEKAAQALQLALSVNQYHGNSWFLMGCAYMRLNKLEQAIKALSKAVSVEENNAEGWANLSGCLQKIGQFNQAQSIMEQAVKVQENNWRMWSNLMMLSIKNKKFQRFYSCVQKLLVLKQRDVIDESIVVRIVQSYKYQVETQARSIKFVEQRIEKLFELMCQEMGTRVEVWEQFAQFLEIVLDKLDKDVDEGQQEESKVKFEINEEQKNSKSDRMQKLKQRIAEYRLNGCQAIMKIGWEVDVECCKKLKVQLMNTKQSFQGVMSEQQIKNLQMLIDSSMEKINKTLE